MNHTIRTMRWIDWVVFVVIVVFVGAVLLVACGSGATHDLREGEFITVTDELTGRQFRCLYVDGDYASDMLCYDYGG